MIKSTLKFIFSLVAIMLLQVLFVSSQEDFITTPLLKDKLNYQHTIYEIYDQKLDRTTIVTKYWSAPVNCSFHFMFPRSYNPNEIEPSNLVVKVNNQDLKFIDKDSYLKEVLDKGYIKQAYTFTDPCKLWEFGIRNCKLLLGPKSILIHSGIESSVCSYEVQLRLRNYSRWERDRHIKRFNTTFLRLRGSDYFIVEIKTPEKNKIVDYNLKEHGKVEDENKVKWVLNGTSKDSTELFWITYKKPILAQIDDIISQNIYYKIMLHLLAIYGIYEIFEKFVRKKTNKPKEKKE